MGKGERSAVVWVRTIGAPTAGDPRDGELHQVFGALPDHFDLEPWDEEELAGGDVRYFRADAPPIVDQEGRTVWRYEYRGDTEH